MTSPFSIKSLNSVGFFGFPKTCQGGKKPTTNKNSNYMLILFNSMEERNKQTKKNPAKQNKPKKQTKMNPETSLGPIQIINFFEATDRERDRAQES